MQLPLFPLNTVLLPGSRLELRIFEPRYLDMIRDCMRAQSGFGVCLITRGEEIGIGAVPASMGTHARIVDFCSLPDGLLGITALGDHRFVAERTHTSPSGLLLAEVHMLSIVPPQAIPAEYAVLVTILQRLADQDDSELSQAAKHCFDDADWVGYRLADRLPITLVERQQFLEIDSAIARLDQLAQWLPRFQKE